MNKILTLWAAVPLYWKITAASAGVVALMVLEAYRAERDLEDYDSED